MSQKKGQTIKQFSWTFCHKIVVGLLAIRFTFQKNFINSHYSLTCFFLDWNFPTTQTAFVKEQHQ